MSSRQCCKHRLEGVYINVKRGPAGGEGGLFGEARGGGVGRGGGRGRTVPGDNRKLRGYTVKPMPLKQQ